MAGEGRRRPMRVWITTVLTLAALSSAAVASSTLLSENFDSAFPPSGWHVDVATGDVTWAPTADEAANRTSSTPGRALAAEADARGTTQAYDASLITPIVRLPSAEQLFVRFDTMLETSSGFEAADVDVYSVADDTWTTVQHWTDADLWQGSLSGRMNVQFPQFASSEVRLRFRYWNDLSGAGGDLGWQIDNVEIVAGNIWGDADYSGDVNLADFVILKNHFGMTGATWMKGDFNHDRKVDLTDFVILKNNFGESVHVAEPLSLSLLGLGLLVLPRRKG